jgi:hypothetical protein
VSRSSRVVVLCGLIGLAVSSSAEAPQERALPSPLEKYVVATVRPTARERETLTALELRVLLPDRARGTGFWFVTISRSRSDGLSGFVGGLVRGRVRNEAAKGVPAVLNATDSGLEPTAP